MSKPILFVFLISHYCEKARWALDYCGVDYDVSTLMPATHAATVKKAGAKGSALPILRTIDGQIIEGSADILAWANENGERKIFSNEASTKLEKQADKVLGVHTRRWFYSEALLDCPDIVKPVFGKGASILDKLILNFAWPKITKVMIKRMDLGAQQELDSKAIVLTEFDNLDALLKAKTDDSPFLINGQLSNADIAIASLIAPLLEPKKHPASSVLRLPPRLESFKSELQKRPFAHWLHRLYEESR